MSSRRHSKSRTSFLSPTKIEKAEVTQAFEEPVVIPQSTLLKSTPLLDTWQFIISSLFVILLMVTPFLFTWFNEELFEFNKMIFVYFMTALIGGAWLARMILQKRVIVVKTWFDIPILLFVISQLLATFFSIHPRTSIFGYYSRFHGGLLSTGCYVLLFYAAISNLQARLIPRLLKATFVSGLVVTLLAIPEHFGRAITCFAINSSQDVFTFNLLKLWNNSAATCWIQDVQSRVFATFGQPNWLAAYAITLIPLGGALALTRKNKTEQLLYGVTTALLFITLLFTKSRSGILGLAVGLAVLGVMGAAIWRRERSLAPKPNRLFFSWKWLFGLTVVFGLSVVFFGTPYTPAVIDLIKKTPSVTTLATAAPVVDRLEAGGTDSGEIRKIVWEGALKVWQRYPLFGSGVETFAYSYYQDRPLAHNLVSEWDFLYNKAHNEFLNFLATTGIVGLLSYCLLLSALLGGPLYLAWKYLQPTKNKTDALPNPQQALVMVSITAGLIALSISNFLGFSTVMVTVLLFLLPAFAWLWSHPEVNTQLFPKPVLSSLDADQTKTGQWAALLGTMLLVGALCFCTAKAWLADYLFFQAKQELRAGLINEGIPKMQWVLSLTPNEATFYDEAAGDYAQLAIGLAQNGDATGAAQLASSAVKASQKMTELNPVNVNFYKTQARAFLTLSQLEPSFFDPALQSLKIAHDLAPTDAKVLYNLALLELSMGQKDQGRTDLEKVVEIKSNYESARQTLAQQYEEQGKIDAARTQYQYILQNIQPNNEVAKQRLEAIATMSATTVKPGQLRR